MLTITHTYWSLLRRLQSPRSDAEHETWEPAEGSEE